MTGKYCAACEGCGPCDLCGSSSPEEIHFDFNKPHDAREFLRGLKYKGEKIEGIYLKDGVWKAFHELSDDEAMDYASDIYSNYLEKESKHVSWEPHLH